MSAILEALPSVLAVAVAVLALASAIAKLTPTPVDDSVVAFLVKLVQWVSLLEPKGVAGFKAPLVAPKAPDEPLLREKTDLK